MKKKDLSNYVFFKCWINNMRGLTSAGVRSNNRTYELMYTLKEYHLVYDWYCIEKSSNDELVESLKKRQWENRNWSFVDGSNVDSDHWKEKNHMQYLRDFFQKYKIK